MDDYNIRTMKIMHKALEELQRRLPHIYEVSEWNYSAMHFEYSEKLDIMGLLEKADNEELVKLPDNLEIENKINTDINRMVVTVHGEAYFECYMNDSAIILTTKTKKISDWENAMK